MREEPRRRRRSNAPAPRGRPRRRPADPARIALLGGATAAGLILLATGGWLAHRAPAPAQITAAPEPVTAIAPAVLHPPTPAPAPETRAPEPEPGLPVAPRRAEPVSTPARAESDAEPEPDRCDDGAVELATGWTGDWPDAEPAPTTAPEAPRTPDAARVANVLTLPASSPTSAPSATPVHWTVRCEELLQLLRRSRADAREQARVELGGVVAESVSEGLSSPTACQSVLAFYDGHPVAAKALPELDRLLAPLHAAYFEDALRRASGPAGFQALARWAREHGHPEWVERLAPWLRLLPDARGADERARARRAQALEATAAYQSERLAQLFAGLQELLDGLTDGCPPALRADLEALAARALPAADAAALRARLEALPTRTDAAAERAARTQLRRLTDRVTARLLDGVDTCLEAGEPGLGFDLLQQLLAIDPEHPRAHRGLGHVQVEGRWLRRYEAQRWSAGQEWLPGAGWVRRSERSRWEAGECCDPERGWSSREEADRRHADPATPWTIETEHFRLRSTAPLARSAEVAERLEAFYLAMFSRLDLFFAGRGGAALVFGVSATPRRHEVFYYGSRAQYLSHAQADPKTAGFYDPSRRCAFFYEQEDWRTLQHELTHEILAESSPGLSGRAAWLVEGTAVYLEDARLVGGAIVLPGARERPFLRAHLQAGRELGVPVSELVTLDQAGWNAVSTPEHYGAAGALVYFLCHADGGRYRGDLVRMLLGTYQGRPVSLPEATGLSLEAVAALEEHFLAGE